MPCGDNGQSEYYFKQDLAKMKALLCSTCRELEERNFDFDKNPALSQWWHKHKIEDEQRELKEAAELMERKLTVKTVKEILAKDPNTLTYDEMTYLYNKKFITYETYTNFLTNKGES